MDAILQIILAVIGGGLVTGVFNLIVWRLNRKAAKEDKSDDLAAGLRILLYDRIKHLGCAYIAANEVSTEALEDLIAMHKVYHDNLDGNGYLDSIMSRVKRLPMKGV
jgi:hypothetical protein